MFTVNNVGRPGTPYASFLVSCPEKERQTLESFLSFLVRQPGAMHGNVTVRDGGGDVLWETEYGAEGGLRDIPGKRILSRGFRYASCVCPHAPKKALIPSGRADWEVRIESGVSGGTEAPAKPESIHRFLAIAGYYADSPEKMKEAFAKERVDAGECLGWLRAVCGTDGT